MLDVQYYKPKYKTAFSRVFYLIRKKKYLNWEDMAADLGCSRQYLGECMREGIPVKMAGYLGRKFGFHPALLNHETYLNYESVRLRAFIVKSRLFTTEDEQYILEGIHIENPDRFIEKLDKEYGR